MKVSKYSENTRHYGKNLTNNSRASLEFSMRFDQEKTITYKLIASQSSYYLGFGRSILMDE